MADAAEAEEQRRSVVGLAAAVHDLVVLLHEAETIDLFVDEDVVHSRDVCRRTSKRRHDEGHDPR